MKILRIMLCAACAAVVTPALAESVKLRLHTEAPALLDALASLDGVDRVLDQGNGQPAKMVRTPYDFGKDSVRIRLAIRKNLIALRDAMEAYEEARVGYLTEVWGKPSVTEAEAKSDPAKLARFNAKVLPLLDPTAIELVLFAPEDVTTFAAAGVPGTVSVALDRLVAKPAK